MLASLVQTLSTAFGDMLEWALNAFMEALSISNLSSYLDIFPLLSTFYMYLRSFAVAMTAIIAGKALATFAMGSIDSGNAKDNPGMVLVKTFFAVGGIYWGGYVLDYIVHLGSIPYEQFMNVNAVGLGTSRVNVIGALLEGLAGLAGAWAPGLALGLLELFVLAIIAWNLFKLVLEVCERWLMVGILVYTSPLVYCTIPSHDTSQIFKRWASMFVGSVMQMSLSVMFLKLILSGFNGNSDTPFFLKMLMILALCKIAQRMDSYLQQLGVGVATTGGNMLDDVIASVHALSRFGRGGGKASSEGGSRQGILGAAFSRSNLGVGLGAARRAWNNNASIRDSIQAGAKAASDNFKNNAFAGRAVKEINNLNARKSAAANATGAAGKATGKANGGAAAATGKKPGTAANAQQGRAGQPQTSAKPASAAAGASRPAESATAEKATTDTSKTEAPKTPMRATGAKADTAQVGKDTRAETNDAAAQEAAAAVAPVTQPDTAKPQKEDTEAKTADDKEGIKPDAGQVAAGAAAGSAAMGEQDAVPASPDQKADDDKQHDAEAVAKGSAEEKVNQADTTAGDGNVTKDPSTGAGESVGDGSGQDAQHGAAADGKAGTAEEYSGRAVSGQPGADDKTEAAEAEAKVDQEGKSEETGGTAPDASTPQSSADVTMAAGEQGSGKEAYSGRAVSGHEETEGGVGNAAAAADAQVAGQDKVNQSEMQPVAYSESNAGGSDAGEHGTSGDTYTGRAGGAGSAPGGDSGARIDVPPAQKFDPADPTQEPQTLGQALRRAFHGSHQYAFGRTGEAYTAADYKNAEQTVTANRDAVSDRSNEFATGHEAMPQSVRENAEQIINGNPGVRRPSASDAQTSFRTSGVSNASGNVLESTPEGDLRLTPQAVAAGAEISEIKNADGSTSKVLQDRSVAGMVAGAYMASAIDQNAVTNSGERTYSAVEGKSDFVQQRMGSNDYYAKAGQEQAAEQRTADNAVMENYEATAPETKAARSAERTARNDVDTLRAANAAPETIRAAEASHQAASEKLYQATVAAGTRKIEEAQQRMAAYDKQGMSHNAPEYRAAAQNYQEHRDNLAEYQAAHSRASTPGYYEGVATRTANELRESEAAAHAATYDAVQKDAVGMLNNTIQNASPIALSKALLDPNYHPADCAETRAIADRLFGEFLQDRKTGSQIQSVVVTDHSSNATISGQELDGGRSIAVTYTKKDGSTGTATFMDAVGTTSLPDGLREKLKVCKTGDGREWLSEGVGINLSAHPTGTQVRRSSTVSKVFSMLRKLTK